MKTDYVQVICNLYVELAQYSELTEAKELPMWGIFSPVKPEVHSELWAKITPNIHNPQGKFTRSACLRVYDHSGFEGSRVYLELQALGSDDPELPNSLQAFLLMPGFGGDPDKIEICKSIVLHVRELADNPVQVF